MITIPLWVFALMCALLIPYFFVGVAACVYAVCIIHDFRIRDFKE